MACKGDVCFREAVRRVSEGICPAHDHPLRRIDRTSYCDRTGMRYTVESHHPGWEYLGPGPYLTWGQTPGFPWKEGYEHDLKGELNPDPHLVLAEPCSECECWERRSGLDLPIARWYPY